MRLLLLAVLCALPAWADPFKTYNTSSVTVTEATPSARFTDSLGWNVHVLNDESGSPPADGSSDAARYAVFRQNVLNPTVRSKASWLRVSTGSQSETRQRGLAKRLVALQRAGVKLLFLTTTADWVFSPAPGHPYGKATLTADALKKLLVLADAGVVANAVSPLNENDHMARSVRAAIVNQSPLDPRALRELRNPFAAQVVLDGGQRCDTPTDAGTWVLSRACWRGLDVACDEAIGATTSDGDFRAGSLDGGLGAFWGRWLRCLKPGFLVQNLAVSEALQRPSALTPGFAFFAPDVKRLSGSWVHLAALRNEPAAPFLPASQTIGDWAAKTQEFFDDTELHLYCFGGSNFVDLEGCVRKGYEEGQGQFGPTGTAAKPVFVSETGFFTKGGPDAVPDSAALAQLTLRELFSIQAKGATASVVYVLIDDDRASSTKEATFGALRSDGGTKASFDAIARVAQLLDDPGPRLEEPSLDGFAPTVSRDGGTLTNLGLVSFTDRYHENVLALWNKRPPLPLMPDGGLVGSAFSVELRVNEAARARVLSTAGAPAGEWRTLQPADPLAVTLSGDVLLVELRPLRTYLQPRDAPLPPVSGKKPEAVATDWANTAYLAVLGRMPSSAERAGAIPGLLTHGYRGWVDLFRALGRSAEFSTRLTQKGTNVVLRSAYVELVRPLDEEQAAAWVAATSKGFTAALAPNVFAGFAASQRVYQSQLAPLGLPY